MGASHNDPLNSIQAETLLDMTCQMFWSYVMPWPSVTSFFAYLRNFSLFTYFLLAQINFFKRKLFQSKSDKVAKLRRVHFAKIHLG